MKARIIAKNRMASPITAFSVLSEDSSSLKKEPAR